MNGTDSPLSLKNVLLSVTQVISNHRGSYLKLLGCWLLISVVIGGGLNVVYRDLGVLEGGHFQTDETMVLPVLAGGTILFAMLLFLFFFSLFVYFFLHHISGKEPTLREGIRTVIKKFYAIILYLFFLIIIAVLPQMFSFGLPSSLRKSGIIFSLLAFVALEYAVLTTFFVIPVVLFEEEEFFLALKRSKNLMHGIRAKTIGYYFLIFVIPVLLLFLIVAPSLSLVHIYWFFLPMIAISYTLLSAGIMSTMYIRRRIKLDELIPKCVEPLFD